MSRLACKLFVLLLGLYAVGVAISDIPRCDPLCQLVNAVKTGDAGRIKNLFEAGQVAQDALLPSNRHVSTLLMLTENNDVVDVILQYNSIIDDITFVECVTNDKSYAVSEILKRERASEKAKGIALASAVMLGKVDFVKLLLKNGAEVTVKDYFGRSATKYALEILDESSEIKQLILGNSNARNHGDTH